MNHCMFIYTQIMDDIFMNDDGRLLRMRKLSNGCYHEYFYFMNKIWFSILQKKKTCHIGEECPICLESCNSQKKTWITLCGHIFHKHCLREYFLYTPEDKGCPMCRNDLKNVIGK
jgi:hypothetical protein